MPTEQKKERGLDRRVIGLAAAIVILVGGGIAGVTYYEASSKVVKIDNSTISAPLVDLTATAPGVLNAVYVNPGDTIPPNTVVAEVGTELIKSSSGGLVVMTNDNIGKNVTPADIIVETIDPASLRVVGEVDENKGLTKIKVGDPVTFTVDAFGSQSFTGVVDEIAPTANSSGIVFNISDQRETQQFDVKARFDTAEYPQLKNGMSARMKVYVN